MHGIQFPECSPVSQNIVDNPSCTCGGFESPYHYFYVCPNYTNLRNECFDNELERLTDKELLFGIQEASVEENEALFAKVQDFIIKSKRFIQFPIYMYIRIVRLGEDWLHTYSYPYTCLFSSIRSLLYCFIFVSLSHYYSVLLSV